MKTLVVGVDGSLTSASGLAHALRLGRAQGATVHALHCWQSPVWAVGPVAAPVEVGPSTADAEQWARELLEASVSQAREQLGSPTAEVVEELRHGDPARELLVAAESADLLVVGGRAHGGTARVLLGAVTDTVLHRSPCPVLVVPSAHYQPWQRVVVGCDGSPASRTALRWAADVARSTAVPLVLARAWMLSTLPGADPETVHPSSDAASQGVRRWLLDELARCVPAADLPDAVETVAVHAGASAALLDLAGDIDLLVVGARGQGGFAGLVLGSVASQCARHTGGPLVVVPAG